MTSADRPYTNNTTQEERKRLIVEASLPTTYHKLAGLDDDLGGRFREKQTIAGEQAATQYPKQDSASPWSGSGADPGVEPPTGVAIDAMEPCGEQFEIERSLDELGEPAGASTHPACQNQELKSALEAGSPPELAGGLRSSGLTPATVASTLAVSSPASSERGPRPSSSTKLRRKITG